jgi:cytochrome c553
MIDVGRRFETAGRAVLANRFELAEFEVGEIQEAFENDVPHAAPPKEGPTAHIVPMAADFVRTILPELKRAAATKDADSFAKAFQSASAACNSCHTASAKPFIQVPSVPGKPVPDTDPLPMQRP